MQSNFVVYKSSAGSGKTFTLVREYLKIVIRNPELFRNILAITFTNAAANEMKERIVRYLISLAGFGHHGGNGPVGELLKQLAGDLSMTEEQVCARAEKVLRLIMHHYGEFSVSTIDSFTHRVIRTFAHDLDIPMNFEVELDSDVMLSEAVDTLISLVGVDSKLTRILVDFVEKKTGDELSWQIENDLNDFGKALLNEDSIPFITDLRNYDLDTFMEVRGKLQKWKSQFEHEARQLALKAFTVASNAGISVDSIHQKSKGVLTYLEKLSKSNSEFEKPNSYAANSLETGVWLGKQADPAQKAAFEAVQDRIVPAGMSLFAMIEKDFPRYTVCRLLLNHLYATALLSEIEKILHASCAENNKLLISEFNRRISSIVREQPAPFIYERLGERYQHYLLDEFQDTSIMQWHNLLPLVENSLASSRLNLVVGDAKQAIYRWRAGDARQFEMLPNLIRETTDPLLDSRERTLVAHFRQENLGMNHRSSPVIVDFNNRFFNRIQSRLPDGYNGLYGSARQDPARKEKPGLVRIEVAQKDEPAGTTYAEAVHEKILGMIMEAREDGYSLKDIAILCRENKKAGNIATFLIRQGISVISSESLLLTQSEHVNFLITWLKFLSVKNDPVSISHLLFYLTKHGHLAGENFDRLYTDQFRSKADIKDQPPVDPAPVFIRLLETGLSGFDFGSLKNRELPGLLRYLCHYFRIDIRTESYVRFFMDTVMDFLKKNRGGIPEFLDWWEEKKDKASLVIPEGIDAVRIMTIHKSKGLQFPVVIYPFADEESKPTRKNLWVRLEEELALPLKTAYLPAKKALEGTVYEDVFLDEKRRSEIDTANVLYVALTRPEERLYVITGKIPVKTDSTLTVPKMFSYFLQAEGLFEDGKRSYQFGERFARGPEKPVQVPSETAEDHQPEGRASLNLLLRKHAPASWDMDDPDKSREWGILVHDLMSVINGPDDVPVRIREMTANGDLSKEQAGKLQALASEMIHDPGLAAIFEPGYEVRNEAEIITRDGNSFRPDRVLVKDKHAIIVDYKTGSYKDFHRDQIGNYADLLKSMGYSVDKAMLVYLDRKPEVVRVI